MARDTIQGLAVEVEGIKKDIENANVIHSRLDTAIDKLTDVSTSIKSMLAVHEQKLAQSEKTEEILEKTSPGPGLDRKSAALSLKNEENGEKRRKTKKNVEKRRKTQKKRRKT